MPQKCEGCRCPACHLLTLSVTREERGSMRLRCSQCSYAKTLQTQPPNRGSQKSEIVNPKKQE
jgi:hypothetical protein